MQGGHPILGHFPRIFRDPSGEPQRDWIDNVPNDGVLYYRWLFNESRILITNPKALGEVLVQRNYEFVKPARIRKGLGRLLGVGILLAEGDEHKVCYVGVDGWWVNWNSRDAASEKASHAGFCIQTCQGPISNFLGKEPGDDRPYCQDY